MRRLACLMALAALAAAPPTRPTEAMKRRFDAGLALLGRAERLHDAGRHADALALLHEVHESDLALFGPFDFQTADTLGLMASVHAALRDSAASADCFARRAVALGKLHGEGHWRQREALESRRDMLRLGAATPEARAGGREANEALARFGKLAAAGDYKAAAGRPRHASMPRRPSPSPAATSTSRRRRSPNGSSSPPSTTPASICTCASRCRGTTPNRRTPT